MYTKHNNVRVRRDGGGGHGHAHAHAPAPSSGYAEPSPSYGAPSPSYGAPSSGYDEPSPSYGTPDTGYNEPSPSYGGNTAPSYGGSGGGGASYGADDGGLFPFDLSTLIIPLLAIIGLSLLFPTITSVAVGNKRKKRALEKDANPMTDVVERVNEIYNSVITSEQCMERIACELGGLASDVGLKESPMAKMADLFVTAKYKPYYKQFKSGQNCEKIKCGSLPF